jgi:hypothetical protein
MRWMGIIFISHRHDAWPHAWMDEKHVNPPSYYITGNYSALLAESLRIQTAMKVL